MRGLGWLPSQALPPFPPLATHINKNEKKREKEQELERFSPLGAAVGAAGNGTSLDSTRRCMHWRHLTERFETAG
ncbi:hypothetical protein ACSS6W_002792 [Trichoderma asperelloides]